MDNPLLKYSAKEYFFKASLCHFIVDELNAKVSFLTKKSETFHNVVSDSLDSDEWSLHPSCFNLQLAVEKYEEMFPAFSDSRECKLLKVCKPRV